LKLPHFTAACLLIAQSETFSTVAPDVSIYAVVASALRVFQQFTGFYINLIIA